MEKQASRTKNTVLNLVTSFGGQLLKLAMMFVTRTVFIHTLGKAYLGINGLFSDILTMLSLTELGLDAAINFRLYKPLAEHDDKRVRVLMKFYKQAYRAVGAAIMVIGLCMIPLLPLLIRDYASLQVLGVNAVLIFILYLLQSVTSYLFWAYRSAVVRAEQKEYLLSGVEYGITVATNLAQIVILAVYRSIVLYTATVIVFNILKNYINARVAQRRYPQFFTREEDSLTPKEVFGLLKDCGILFLTKMNDVVLSATDNLILSSFLGLGIVGLYSNYLMLYTAVQSLLGKFYGAVNASIGNLFAVEGLEKKYLLFRVMNFLTVVLYGTAGVGVALCADTLVEAWLGKDYVIAPPFAVLLGIEILLLGMRLYLVQIRNVSGVFTHGWYRPLLSAVCNIVISIALVKPWGICGVALGTVISTVLTYFVIDPKVIYRYAFDGAKPLRAFYSRNLLYMLTLAGVYMSSRLLFAVLWPRQTVLLLLFKILLSGISAPAALILLFWRSEECRYVRKLIKTILKPKKERTGMSNLARKVYHAGRDAVDALKAGYQYSSTQKSTASDLRRTPQPELTAAEKQEIDTYWSRYGIRFKTYNEFRYLYGLTGIRSPRFIPASVYGLILLKYYNEQNGSLFARAYNDKNLLYDYTPELNLPEPVLKCIDGVFYDAGDAFVPNTAAAASILEKEPEVIVKQSLDTNQGMGVKKYSIASRQDAEAVLTNWGGVYQLYCSKAC